MTTALKAPIAGASSSPLRKASGGKVAFVLSQFPQTHETFILREFVALEKAGLDFIILSLKACRDKVVQKDARPFLAKTYYPWDASPGGPGDVGALFRAAAASRGSLPWLGQPAKSAYVAWAAGRLARLARGLHVDHIHAHWATAPTSAAVVISQVLGVPYSFTAHAWDIFTGDGRLAQKAAAAKFIVTCTRDNVGTIRSMIKSADHAKVVLNYHGVPLAAHRCRTKSRSDTLRIAAVGRFVETKGFEYLLDALRDAPFPFELVLVGNGPRKKALQKRAAWSAPAKKVTFVSTVPNETVFRILSESDVFVMPSVVARNGDRDGIPNVMLEAMSVGVPIVATNISGLPEAVIDGRTGFLVPPGSPPAIIQALSAVFADPDRAARMGQAGKDLVTKTFSAEANAASLYDIFARHLCPEAK